MALFGTQRDAKFLASINAELLNAIVDTEIEFYKLIIEDSKTALKKLHKNGKKFNMIHVDGSHSYDDVKEDLKNAHNLLEINGIMKRYERLPMISLDDNEFKHVKNKILMIKKRLNNWKKNFNT